MARIKGADFAEIGDAELLRLTGNALYGDRFQAALAKDLGLPKGFLSEILSGKKPLPERHRATAANLCHRWLMSLSEKRASIEAIERSWRDRL
jgi:hypothetical protein